MLPIKITNPQAKNLTIIAVAEKQLSQSSTDNIIIRKQRRAKLTKVEVKVIRFIFLLCRIHHSFTNYLKPARITLPV